MKKIFAILLGCCMPLMLWNCFGSDDGSIQLWKFNIYDDVWNFSEGMVRVQRGGMYDFLDKEGNVITSALYDAAKDSVNPFG